MHLRKTEEVDLSMYGDSKAITFNKGNVTKQPCHARDQQRVPLLLSQTRQKIPLEDKW